MLDEVTQLSPDPDESTCGIYTKAGTDIFSNNSINGSWIGFHSSGAEEVFDNIIENCKTDGMIMWSPKRS